MAGILGIDIGGVIIERATEPGDTSFFSGAYLQTPPVSGALESIRELRDGVFGDRIHLVSKCGEAVERKTRHWLEAVDFYDRTDIARINVHFCRKRIDKAPICEELGVTAFIDDRLDVLRHLATVERRILFGGNPPPAAASVEHVATWAGVVELLKA